MTRAILRDELRRWWLTPVIALGCFLALALANRVLGPTARYLLPLNWLIMVTFGLCMGGQALAGGHNGPLAQWQAQWPVSRRRWWVTKLLAAGGVAALAATTAVALFLLVAPRALPSAGPDATDLYLIYPLRSAVGAFAIGFFVSSITRASGMAILLGAGLMSVLLYSSVSITEAMLTHGYNYPVWPTYVTMLGPAIFLISFYVGYVTALPLEFARQKGRAIMTAAVLLVLFRLSLVAVQLAHGPA